MISVLKTRKLSSKLKIKLLKPKKMSLTHKIKAALPDPTILVSDSPFSYIKSLIPAGSNSDEIFLLHRKLQSPSKHIERIASLSDDLESTDLDITGSPLHYELDYPKVDETIVEQRNWKKGEELHLPLARADACAALNCCLERLANDDRTLRLLAICDGKDNDKTVLLGSYVEKARFTTVQGHISDARRLSNIEDTPADLLKDYTDRFSVQKHKVRTSVSSTYELCGKRSGVMDASDISPGCFDGNLSIKVNWNTLSFNAPIRTSASTLVMEIIPGWNGGHLKQLWKELTLLHQYLNMLEQCEQNEPDFHTVTSSNPVILKEMKEKLIPLLNGDYGNVSDEDDNDDTDIDIKIDVKLNQHIENVRRRQNMDFADMLWELSMSCVDLTQATSCIGMVLQGIRSGPALPQISSTNSARITKIMSDVICRGEAVPPLGGSLPLELLIDTGLEKLSRDYTWIMSSSNLLDAHNIPQILSDAGGGLFNINSYRKKLTLLGQIHLCLEFTLFAQNYLDCPTANLKSIFSYAFHEYVKENSAIKSFSDLKGNQVQCLDVPLPTVAVKRFVERLPSSWCLTLSYESNTSSITTTSHLNRTPILPPNVYCSDESNEHEVYHVLKLHTSSMKIVS